MKKCTKCGITKKYEEFSKASQCKDGYSYQCKQCVKDYYAKKPKIYVEYKICNKCGNKKHRNEFNKSVGNKDGLTNKCKKCVYEECKTNLKDYKEGKICSYCKEWKPINEFGKQKDKKDGHRSICKKCRHQKYLDNREERREKNREYSNRESVKNRKSKYNKEYYTKNKKSLNKYNQQYYKENKQKLRNQKKKYANYKVEWNSKYPNLIREYEKIREKDGYMEIACTYCGKFFIPQVKQIQDRLKALSRYGGNRVYCSDICKQACPTYRQVKYFKDQKPATSREVQPELRQMVFERDDWACQKCNTHKDDLEVPIHCHHIDPVSQNPIESADVDNCITLCKDCHTEAHQLPDCGYAELRCA